MDDDTERIGDLQEPWDDADDPDQEDDGEEGDAVYGWRDECEWPCALGDR